MDKESSINYSSLSARQIYPEVAVLDNHNKNSVAHELLTIATEYNLQIYLTNSVQKQHNFKCISPIDTCHKIENGVKKYKH